MKKIFLYAILTSLISLPAFALKQIDEYVYVSKTPYKVELRKVQNAQSVSVKIHKTLAVLRLSGIVCDEYSEYKFKESSTGTKYAIEDQRALKKNSRATKYLSDILEANENNIYFQQQGIGYYYSMVGELFVGNQSVNKHLVEKGFCSPIN